MIQTEINAIELQIKEQRVAYWETYHKIPGCREMIDYFDNQSTTI